MNNLKLKTISGFCFLALAMGLLTFSCAGTFLFWQGWLYLLTFFSVSILITVYLFQNDPALLSRRLKGGPRAEKRISQKIIMSFASAIFFLLIAVPALDYRFKWSSVPPWLSIAADFFTALGFYFVFLVYKENSFASATIQIAEDQKLISTGPYSIVRHPMYAGSLVYIIATPIALGSWWGLLVIPVFLPFLIWRLFDEEKLLSQSLPGYIEYCQKVKWRLIPHLF